MVSAIKGIPVTLYERVQTGTDAFNHPVYEETPVIVDNVLVCPVSSTDIVATTQLNGKRAEYELRIPKGDAHIWEDRKVEFFGSTWKTFGFCRQWIQGMVPLDWNKTIGVERYG